MQINGGQAEWGRQADRAMQQWGTIDKDRIGREKVSQCEGYRISVWSVDGGRKCCPIPSVDMHQILQVLSKFTKTPKTVSCSQSLIRQRRRRRTFGRLTRISKNKHLFAIKCHLIGLHVKSIVLLPFSRLSSKNPLSPFKKTKIRI